MSETPASALSVLIVDDEELTVELYDAILEDAGFSNVLTCSDSRKVMDIVRSNHTGVILLDLNMPYVSGQVLLEQLHSDHPEIAVIVLTSEDRVETAVECMKLGAFDYIAKPVEENRLVSAVEHAATIRELRAEVEALAKRPDELSHPQAFAEIVTASPNMLRLFHYIEAVAASPKAVLVTGESGTGKELFARAIHDVSGRSGEFIAVNVSGLDDNMFSDTLFGHVRGAYTGAEGARKGLVQAAAGGTLFLDEIGDLPSGAQVKLLRLLQDGDYYPLGSDRPERAAVRVVAATNADLEAKQEDGSFRKDLYYRLLSHRVHLPPLRERPEDIPLLCLKFAEDAARSLGRQVPDIPAELPGVLASYEFPGNVRELQALVFDAVTRSRGAKLSVQVFLEYLQAHRSPVALNESHFSETASRGEGPADGTGGSIGRPREPGEGGGARDALPEQAEGRARPGVPTISFSGPFPTLDAVEDLLIEEALERAAGNQSVAAKLLGVSQSTLSRRLQNRRAKEKQGH